MKDPRDRMHWTVRAVLIVATSIGCISAITRAQRSGQWEVWAFVGGLAFIGVLWSAKMDGAP